MKNPLIYIIFIAVLFSCGDGVTMELDVKRKGCLTQRETRKMTLLTVI